MPYVPSPIDGAVLYYADYRPPTASFFRANQDAIANYKNTTLFFIHGWPMSGRMYDHLMLPLSQSYGIRCVASDRRGFGKSEWSGPHSGHEVTYDTFARDTLAIIKTIPDLGPFTIISASMGCGESLLVYELMCQEGLDKQCNGFIWMGPSLPYPTKTEHNPHAPSQELWDMIADGFRSDRVAFVNASIGGVFGTQHGIEMSDTALEFFTSLVHQADSIAIERCMQILSNYDFTDKLRNFGRTKPEKLKLMVLHGDKDQSE